MAKLMTLLTAVLAARIALLWQAKAKPSLGDDVSKELAQFLLNASGSDHEVRAFEQQFVGDLEDVQEFLPQVVLDYSEDLFSLAANARVLASSTLFLYSNDDLRVLHPQARPLRENKANVWSTLASRLAKYFGWEEAILLIDWPNKKTVLNTFEEPFTIQLTVSEGLDQGVYDLLVTREIRRSGVHAVFLMTSASITEGMLRAFTKYTMEKGYAFVLLGSHQFDVSLYPTGVLSLALAGSEGAKSHVEVDFWYLLYALTSRPLDQWTIVNTVQGSQYTVGIFDKDSLTISPLVYFPRGITSPPKTEPFQLFYSTTNNYDRTSAIALEDHKLTTKRFEVVPLYLKACNEYDEADLYVRCWIEVNQQLVSLLLSNEYNINPIMQNMFMQATGLLIPFLSSQSLSSYLTSREDYPNFIRIMQDDTSLTPHLALLGKLQKYSKTMVFYEPSFGEKTFQVVLDYHKLLNIEIINRDDDLMNINQYDPDYFNKAAQYVKNSEIRPASFIIQSLDYINFAEAFDKAGLKDEDLVISGITQTYNSIINHTNEGQKAAMQKFMRSFLFSDFSTYMGDDGLKLQERLENRFEFATNSDCFDYDAGTLIVLAFDFMIRRGLDFYDWEEMMFALRNIHFFGCSGAIQFTKDNNNRSSIGMDHSQPREIDGVIKDVKVLRTSVTGQSYYKYTDIEWFDGTSKTPLQNKLNELNCPFPEEYRQDSDKSTDLTIALNWAVVGLCVVLSVVTYITFVRADPFLDNVEAVQLSTQDNIVLASTFIEPLVFDLVSPGINVYALIMGKSIDSRLDWSDRKYFNLLNWVYALAGVALVTSLISALNKFKPLSFDLQLLAAFLVRSLFFVFAFILLSILDCNESQAAGDLELSDAFMDMDCYQQCWTGDHIKYAIASVVILAGLVVLCSTLSSQLTNSLEGLQVYVNPARELVRMPFLLIVIALCKSRPRLSTAAHYSLYLVTLSAYSVVCIRLRVLSIPLLSSLSNVTLLLFLIMNICEFLHFEVYSNTIMWICLGGGLSLTLLGLALLKMRKLPKLLIPSRKIDTEALFRFAFRRNQTFPANRFLPEESSPSQRENLYQASNHPS
jgi:hypothetical protein